MFSFLTPDKNKSTAAQIPPARKASAARAVLAAASAARVAWTPNDPVSLAQCYVRSPIVRRCVRLIAETTASIPFRLREDGAPMAAHPALTLLSRPAPMSSGKALIESLYSYYLIYGDAYLEMVAAESGPSELYALRPDRVRVTPGPDGWPAAWEYAVGGRKHVFHADPDAPAILHVRAFHPSNDHYGLSPVSAALTAIDVSESALKWNKALLDNAARPSGAVVYKGVDGDGRLSDAQYRRLTDELETFHQGAANAGRPMLLEGGLDWRPMGWSPSDMEHRETREAASREIAAALGVPPMLLNHPGDAAYANFSEANRAFYRQTAAPLAIKFASALSMWLSAHYGASLELEPDLDATPAFADDRDALWRKVSSADFLTDGEKRALLGFPEEKPAV